MSLSKERRRNRRSTQSVSISAPESTRPRVISAGSTRPSFIWIHISCYLTSNIIDSRIYCSSFESVQLHLDRIIVHLFVSYAHVNLCYFFSSSWCQGLAATSACGSTWTFLFTFCVYCYKAEPNQITLNLFLIKPIVKFLPYSIQMHPGYARRVDTNYAHSIYTILIHPATWRRSLHAPNIVHPYHSFDVHCLNPTAKSQIFVAVVVVSE